MKRLPNYGHPTEEDRLTYSKWAWRVALFYGVLAIAGIILVIVYRN